MVIIYFAFPTLSMAYQVNVAQNLHEQKGTYSADIYVIPVYRYLSVHVFKQ
jgi:hypothetical protein